MLVMIESVGFVFHIHSIAIFRPSYFFALGRRISLCRSSIVFTSCKCPWQESNLHFSLRMAVSYPLNDKGVRALLEFQSSGDDGGKGFFNLFFFKILQKISSYRFRVGIAQQYYGVSGKSFF